MLYATVGVIPLVGALCHMQSNFPVLLRNVCQPLDPQHPPTQTHLAHSHITVDQCMDTRRDTSKLRLTHVTFFTFFTPLPTHEQSPKENTLPGS